MQSRHIGSLVLLLVGLAAQLAWADKLTIGSPAPAIDIEHWFHDKEPITAFKAGKVYVVEFWATWCGPCLASMPHLAEIQDRHSGDLTVISVSDEDPETVEKFLDREKGDTTFRAITAAYSLTTDPDQSVNKDYMKAAGQNGIPTAFIVGKTGEIEWIGHPMRIDEPVAKVIAGEWDRAAYAAELEEETTVRGRIQVLSRLVQQQKFAEALAVIEEILADVKTPRIRERVEELRQRVSTQADAYAAKLEQEETVAMRAAKAQTATVAGLLDVAFLLEKGDHVAAIAVLGQLIEDSKTPAVTALLEEALARLRLAAEHAGDE